MIDHWVDAADPARSNWLRYVNSPMTEDEANLDFVQFKDEIYYQVIDAIPEGTVQFFLPCRLTHAYSKISVSTGRVKEIEK